jgi:hypothetical protein
MMMQIGRLDDRIIEANQVDDNSLLNIKITA